MRIRVPDTNKTPLSYKVSSRPDQAAVCYLHPPQNYRKHKPDHICCCAATKPCSMRHKQAAPQRKRLAESPSQQQDQQQDQHEDWEQGAVRSPQKRRGRRGTPASSVTSTEQNTYKQVADEVLVSTAPSQQQLGVLAEFVVATKAGVSPPAPGAVPASVSVQLFERPSVRGWWNRQLQQHAVLLLSWHCPGEDEHGPQHEVGVPLCAVAEAGWMCGMCIHTPPRHCQFCTDAPA